MKISHATLLTGALGLLAIAGYPADRSGGQDSGMMEHDMMSPGLMMPSMDAARGRLLFASKGCVVCHSINHIGGEDAPPLDASSMVLPMNPFEFAARMWDGAEAMVTLQREELGEPIQLNGQELADIIAFVHHADEQKKFSDADIPPQIKKLMGHMDKMDGMQEETQPEQ